MEPFSPWAQQFHTNHLLSSGKHLKGRMEATRPVFCSVSRSELWKEAAGLITVRAGADMFFNGCTSQWCHHRRGEMPRICKERVSDACNCSAKTIRDSSGLLTCEQQTAVHEPFHLFYHCRADRFGGFLPGLKASRLFIYLFSESKMVVNVKNLQHRGKDPIIHR